MIKNGRLTIFVLSVGALLGANLVLIKKTQAESIMVTAQVGITVQYACSDGIDNDGDGKIDYPADPGCSSPTDNDETDPPPAPPSGGGGGGGGGVSAPINVPVTTVTFVGRAYPKSTVTLLKDAQVAASTVAGADANFQISLSGLSAGNYIFSLYSEDDKGNRSSLLSFPVSVTSGATTKVSGIFIAPTISVDKSDVKKGDNIAVFGQSAPGADVTIVVNSDNEIFAKTKADANGAYLYNFDTTPLELGQHLAKSKAAINDEISIFGKAVSFNVGTKTTIKTDATKLMVGDLNKDGQVNLVDFSIEAYWYKQASPPVSVDLNKDGKVDLTDLSIMAYYWTG